MKYVVELILSRDGRRTGGARAEEDTRIDAIAKAAYWCGHYQASGHVIEELKIFKVSARGEETPVDLPVLFYNLIEVL